jgi:y4mF family transcriptional regulator
MIKPGPVKYPFHIPLPSYLGMAIRDGRKKSNMSQGDLADITGTSVKFISDVERGKETVQMDKVFDLLRALSIQVYLTDKPLTSGENNGKPFNLLG